MADSKLDHVRRVHIGGEVLQVRSDAPPETIEQVAEVVDNHVRRLMAAGTETDKFRLGVLVALHVAGEMFELRAERDEALAARDGILSRLSEAMAARELAEAERDEALDALARTAVERDEALSSGHRADVPATVPGASAERDEGVLEMRFDDVPRAVPPEAPAASMLASERDEALERCAVLETELGSLHARVHDLLERLEEL